MDSTGAPPRADEGTLVDVQRAAARAALPAEVFGYVDTGSWHGTSRAEAEAAWSAVRLRPRVLVDVSTVDTCVELLGQRLRGPVIVGPTAFHGLAHEEAELATARAASRAGSLLTLSTR
ncbi:MAG TPA: alpha-hydroxy-acid oxidizing protein, partial [Actinomycetes bacterium]